MSRQDWGRTHRPRGPAWGRPEPVTVGRVPEPGETARCPGCGQDVELRPLRRVVEPGEPLGRPGPVYVLHYLPQDGRISPPPCPMAQRRVDS